MFPMFLQLLVLLSWVAGAQGAGGVSIFALGTLIDEKHWDVMFMYFVVFGITMVLELSVHTLHHEVKSRSGTAVVHHITEEVMILGGISALLVLFENLGGAALIDAPLFHYVHFVIFVMAIMFITLVTSLFVTVSSSWWKWERFEHRVSEIENDPALTDNDRAAFLNAYIRSVRNGNRMLSCLRFFRQNLPGKFICVSFSRYMMKMQRKFMLDFLDLRESSWAMLGVLCLLAAVTDYITITISDNPLATIGLWVLIVGFGPLLVLIVLAAKVRREFQDFATNVQEMCQEGAHKPKQAQSSHFWFGSPHVNVMLIQTMLLYQVFYLATTVVNFSYRLWIIGSQDNDRPKSIALIALCFFPSFVVFFIILPYVLPTFTVLASVGEFLDHEVLLTIMLQDKASGKHRRVFKRDKKIIQLAPHCKTEPRRLLLGTDARAERDDNYYDMIRGWDEPDDVVLLTEQDRTAKCEECGQEEAQVKCNRCGLLCAECDINYHKLKLLKDHVRKLFEEVDEMPQAATAKPSEHDDSSMQSAKSNSSGGKPPVPSRPPVPIQPPPPPSHKRVVTRHKKEEEVEAPVVSRFMPPTGKTLSSGSSGSRSSVIAGVTPSAPPLPLNNPLYRRFSESSSTSAIGKKPSLPTATASPSVGSPSATPFKALAERIHTVPVSTADWTCFSCANKNWSARTTCTRCKAAKP